MDGFIKNSEIRLDGDGFQSRDFSYVLDVCKANLLVSKHPDFLGGEAFNVACGQTSNLWDIFKTIQGLTGNIPEIKRLPERAGDVRKTHADISKIKDIGFKYDFSLVEGINLTYLWYKKEIG